MLAECAVWSLVGSGVLPVGAACPVCRRQWLPQTVVAADRSRRSAAADSANLPQTLQLLRSHRPHPAHTVAKHDSERTSLLSLSLCIMLAPRFRMNLPLLLSLACLLALGLSSLGAPYCVASAVKPASAPLHTYETYHQFHQNILVIGETGSGG